MCVQKIMWFKNQVMLFVLVMIVSVSALADGSGVIDPFPETGAYQASLRHDVNSLSVIEFAGNYDREIAGKLNVEPRAVVSKAFLKDHADAYDFLVVFSSFKYNSGNATALHWGVQNSVQGIGLPQYDVSELFGSDGKLQGYIDMGPMDQYVLDPLDPRFEKVLSALGHEVMHQWSGRARFDQGNGIETSLIGRDGSHWSNLLDSDASVLYGHQWRDNGDGSFTSTDTLKFFSALDLYLAGLRSAGEVTPMSLLINQEVAAALTPEQSLLSYGPTIEATTRTISIEDIIAAEGPRVPASDGARQTFRFAFIVLTGQDEVATQKMLGQVNIVRREFMQRFSIWTGGRATAQVFPEGTPLFELDNPEEVFGSDPRLNASSLQEGFAWLRGQQNAEGFWQDKEATLLRDTAVSLDVLTRLDSAFVRQSDGVSWLLSQATNNTDYLARQLKVLTRLGQAAEADLLLARLLSMQNTDGGWGIDANYQSNPLDTALVVDALFSNTSVAQNVFSKASSYLIAQQNNDGGWGSIKNGPSRTSVTTSVLSVLKRMNLHGTVAGNALLWLAAKQNPDGGFGDSPSTSHDTANVLKAMIDLDVIDQIRSSDASEYLLAQQDEQGSWQGSTFTTALSLDALRQFSFPNWSLLNITANLTQVNDGDRVQLAITLRNDSNLPTPAGAIRLYDGEPSSGGVAIGSDIVVPELVPGATMVFRPIWDSFNLSGEHRIVAVVDPGNAVVEMSEQDNLGSVDITVNAAPAGIDLSIIDQDVVVIPNNPNTLPANLGFAVMIRNLGADDAQNVSVQLRRGAEVLGEQMVTVPGRATLASNFSYQLLQAGSVSFNVVIDAANLITEISETNNTANVLLETQNSLDLLVDAISLDTTIPLVGHDVEFNVRLRNRGTNDSPVSTVRYAISDGTTTNELQSNTVQIKAGQQLEQTIVWRVDREADFTFSAVVDPDNLIPELDESNNTRTASFSAGQADGPNLVVDFNDFSFTPNPALEGSALTLSALVRNTGADTANNVEVAFYSGDPSAGGVLIGADTIPQLLNNAAATATTTWASVPDSLDKLLFVVVDPSNAITEFSEEDNRAFNTLTVNSLIDLSISSADITLFPGFPHAGDEVTISARVSNLGQQSADGVVVRAYAGDPNNGAEQIGVDQVFAIEANGVSVLQFIYTLANENTLGSIFIQLDPDNVVAEQNELNNIAQRDFAVQDGNFYVTQRYISPNGDDVQENTQFFFRLAETESVNINILNQEDMIVRRYSGGALNNTSGADVNWDGLDDLGRVVADGRYRFQVSANNSNLGEAVVYVDTNRSPLTQSLGTPFASFKNLTCPVGRNYSFSVSNDDSVIHFSIPRSDSEETYTPGIYRMQGNGTDIQAIVPQSFFVQQQSSVPENFIVSTDGSKLAFFTYISNSNPDQYKTWFIDGDGGNLTEHPRVISEDAIGFNHDNTALINVDNGGLYSEPLDGTARQLIADVAQYLNASNNLYFEDQQFSPDGKSLLVNVNDFSDDVRSLLLINLLTGEIVTIANTTQLYSENNWRVAWAPDGLKFSVLEWASHTVKVFNRSGGLISDKSLPSVHSEVASNSEYAAPATIVGPTWATNSNEFAFIYYFDGSELPELPVFNLNHGGIYTFNMSTGITEQVYQFNVIGGFCNEICETAYSGLGPNTSNFLWAPNERTLLLNSSGYSLRDGLDSNYDPYDRGNFEYSDNTLWAVSMGSEVNLEKVLTNFKSSPRNLFFTSTGRQLIFESLQENHVPDSTCVNSNDQWSFKSLLNLVAELQAVRSQRVGGIVLSGAAADVYFDHYRLDYARSSAPNSWVAIQPAANQSVVDEVFTTWVPPEPGSYFVRLTVRDLAGNQRQVIKRVSWSDTPSITDISRSNSVISPNGDNALDNTTIQYRVLEPVHLEFNLYNESGELVRTIVRDHTQVGSIFEFVWDGRNQSGLLLPDGEYTLVVQDYEFFVTIDSTLPDVTLTLNNAYQSVTIDNNAFVDVNPSIQWSVSDSHYLDSVIQSIPANDPNSVSDLFDLDPSELGEGKINTRFLKLQQLPGRTFSLVAVDSAGNRVVETVGPVNEELMVAKFGQHVIRPAVQAVIDQLPPGSNASDYDLVKEAVIRADGFFESINRAPYAPMNAVDGPSGAVVASQNAVSFLVSETIQAPLSQLSVQYRAISDAQWLDAPLDLFYTDDVNETSVLKGFVPDQYDRFTTDLNDQFRAVWQPQGINAEALYVVRLRSVDEANKEHFSNAIRVRFAGGVAFRGLTDYASSDEWLDIITPLLKGQAPKPGEFILWGQEFIADQIVNARLFVSSNADPRYRIEQEIGISYSPDGGFIFRTQELSSCQDYNGYVTVTTANGTQTSSELMFSTPCVDLRVVSEPISVEACNQPGRDEIVIKFAPSSIDGRELSLLTLAPASDANDILFNINSPESVAINNIAGGQVYAYEYRLDTSGIADGRHNFIAYLENIDGQSATLNVSVLVDRTAPSLAFSYPSETGLVCGVQRELSPGVINNVLTLEGSIQDANGLHYKVELANGPVFVGEGELIHDSRHYDSFLAANNQKANISPPKSDFHLNSFNGSLAEIFNRDGEYTARLSVFDQGGFLQCTSRTFVFDGQVDISSSGSDVNLFSPNGDGYLDNISFAYTLDENVTLDIEVYAAVIDEADGSVRINGDVLSTVVSQEALLAGSGSSSWNGLDDSSTVLPDGFYTALLRFTDACGNQTSSLLPFTIDNSGPQISINYPGSNDPLQMMVEVIGSISDKHFQSYAVEIGVGIGPQTWTRIGSGTAPVVADVLARWNTFGLLGDYRLRVSAQDQVGNNSEQVVPLSLNTRINLMTYLEAIESHFSPNNDGQRELSSIRVGLDEASLLTINIFDANGTLRRQLFNQQSFAKGPVVVNWDGRDANNNLLADGVYSVSATAMLASNTAIEQNEVITVVLDATAPVINIQRPSSGFVSGKGAVIGSITDEFLTHYSVSLTGNPSAPVWDVLSEGNSSVNDFSLGSLQALEEGSYALRVIAVDKGDTRVEQVIPFIVDNTKPEILLLSPVDDSVLGGQTGLISIVAELTEANPARYELHYGLGSKPDSFVEITSGENFPLSTPLMSWDATGLTDGIYTLRLRVTDGAGLSADSQRVFTLDNTMPIASITSPANNGFVTAGTDIIGSASDENLSAYTLAVAPGSIDASQQFSEIGSSSVSIDNSTLLNWQALPVDGPYTLRLQVKDHAGNQATTLQAITVDTQAPSVPVGLTADLNSAQALVINWQANTDSDLAGYYVYRSGVRISSELVTGTRFIDSASNEGTVTYSVSAVDNAGLESPRSQGVEVLVDNTPPLVRITSPVSGATVSSIIDIEGSAFSQDDFKEYRVYISLTTAPDDEMLLRRSPVAVQGDILTQWNTLGLVEGGHYIVRLEAEDINGNIEQVSVSVIIDNEAPAAPTGLTASLTGENVDLNWVANNETDLLGYLIYRNDRLVNSNATVINELSAFAIATTQYNDLSLADGDYLYSIVAIDLAGNTSAASNTANISLDTRIPKARIVTPEDQTEFEIPLYILAASNDQDIASVQFQYRSAASSTWLDLGSIDTAAPYEASFTPGALSLSLGDYLLRAVATDNANKVDASPEVISVSFADLTRPDRVTGLTTVVNAADVTLSWAAGTEADIAGYHIDRIDELNNITRITSAAVISANYSDENLDDGVYHYSVVAVDNNDNESQASESVEALVYTPTLLPLMNPTLDSLITVRGAGLFEATVIADITNGLGNASLPQVETDLGGAFALANIALEEGGNTVNVALLDRAGNTSKTASITLLRANVPSQPTGLIGSAVNTDVTLSWNANPEINIIGYRLMRNGENVLSTAALTSTSATASSQSSWRPASAVVDGVNSTYWDTLFPINDQWISISWAQAQLISSISVHWYTESTVAKDFNVEALFEGEWVRLLELRNFESDGVEDTIQLPQAYRTTQIRIHAAGDDYFRVAELKVNAIELINATSFSAVEPDGEHDYCITAVNEYGFESIQSDSLRLNVGDITAPNAVILSASVDAADVTLSWSASTSTDLAQYHIYRDGEPVSIITDLSTLTYIDNNRPNGSYQYNVHAVDTVGNVSLSNSVDVIVLIAAPDVPIGLAVEAVDTGGALSLNWDAGTEPAPVGFRVFRSEMSGGPYEIVGNTNNLQFTDVGLSNGVIYYYVIAALDAAGNLSMFSTEVSAKPEDNMPPSTPILYSPTTVGHLYIANEPTVNIVGSSEPGTTVELIQAGISVSQTTASRDVEIHTVQNEHVSPQGRLSPSGTLYAYAVLPSNETELHLYDFETDSTQLLTTVPHDYYLYPSWSANGKEIIFTNRDAATSNFMLQRYSLVDGSITNITDPQISDIMAGVLSPNGNQLAVLGYVETDSLSAEGMWLLNLTSQQWTLLKEGNSYNFNAFSMRWSPNGSMVSYVDRSSGEVLEVVDVNTGTVHIVDTQYSNNYVTVPDWSIDGNEVLYASQQSGDRQIWKYDFNLGMATQVTSGSSEYEMPQWSPDNKSISFVDLADNKLTVLDLDTATETVLSDGYIRLYDSIEWLSTGYLVASVDYALTRFTPAGQFEFNSVPLSLGDNNFSVTARDEAANRSDESGEILIRYSLEAAPDLVVRSEGLRITPLVPSVNSPSQISVTVSNIGQQMAGETQMSLLVVEPNGQTVLLLDNFMLNPIAANASQTVSASWQVGVDEGRYRLITVVDTDNRILESSESNNYNIRDVWVSSSLQPVINITSDKVRYDAEQDVYIGISISNPGDSINGRLQVSIEDENGYLVQTLDNGAVNDFSYGTNIERSLQWNIGSTYAGNYQVTARLYNERDELISSGISKFEIGENSLLESTVTTDKKSYIGNSIVKISGTVSYSSGNSTLSNLDMLVRIIDDAGIVLREYQRALNDLAPESNDTISFDWDTGSSTVGEYLVDIQIFKNGEVVSESSNTFFIKANEIEDVDGQLDIDNVEVNAGDSIQFSYAVSNIGTLSISQLPISVSLVDSASLSILDTINTSYDLEIGAQSTTTASFSTSSIAINSYTVILQAEINRGAGDTQLITLDSARISVRDRKPPVISLIAPTNNSFINGAAVSRVMAIDYQSLIDRVEARIDEGLWTSISIQDSTQNLYGQALPSLTEGQHSYQVRAIDSAGNISVSSQVIFSVDNQAPIVAVEGVTDGELTDQTIVPSIAISDTYLDFTEILLNGAAYLSGTPIDATGLYSLYVHARDLAGNITEQIRVFGIDKSAPFILFDGVEDGDVLAEDVTIYVDVSDSNLLSESITLNGQAFESGATITEDGDYEFIVNATDIFNHDANLQVNFKIDKTKPTVSIESPANGAQISAASVSINGISEANATITLQIDGADTVSVFTDSNGLFEFENIALLDGLNEITFYAQDQAGNLSDVVVLSLYRVLGSQIELEARLQGNSNVLVWLANENNGMEALLSNALNEQSAEYKVVYNQSDFIKQLRRGLYATVLLADVTNHSHHRKHEHKHSYYCDYRSPRGHDSLHIDNKVQSELRPLVAAGLGLVFIKTHAHDSHLLQDVFGAKVKGRMYNIDQVGLESNPVTESGIFNVNGSALRISATTGTEIGKLLPTQRPAMVVNQYVDGKSVLLGFNPLDLEDEVSASAIVKDALNYVKPTELSMLANTVNTLVWTASGFDSTLDVNFENILAQGMEFISVDNDAVIGSDGVSATWVREVNASSSEFRSHIKLPSESGEHLISARLYQNDIGQLSLLSEAEFRINSVVTQAQIEELLLAKLNNLTVSYYDKFKKKFVLRYVNWAISAAKDSKQSTSWAISQLRYAYKWLSHISSPENDIQRLIGQLLGSYQKIWSDQVDVDVAPEFSFIKPLNAHKINKSVLINWVDSDPDSNATISLYYDTDQQDADGMLIVSDIDEDADGSNDIFHWKIDSDTPDGQYYIYAVISDDSTTKTIYAPGLLTIDKQHRHHHGRK